MSLEPPPPPELPPPADEEDDDDPDDVVLDAECSIWFPTWWWLWWDDEDEEDDADEQELDEDVEIVVGVVPVLPLAVADSVDAAPGFRLVIVGGECGPLLLVFVKTPLK